MSDIPLLPNPFKMLDLEREKRMKPTSNKCNNCEDKKEGFNNLKKGKSVVEGMSETDSRLWFTIVLIGISIIWLLFGVLGHKSSMNVISNTSQSKFILLVSFLFFASHSAYFHTNDNDDYKYPIALLVGLAMWLLRFLPGLIGYFENTVGYLVCLILSSHKGGLNNFMGSDNFDALVMYNDEVTINFNPLMSLFNLENWDSESDQMRVRGKEEHGKEDDGNTSDFYVHSGKNEEVKKYIHETVIIKRVSGEVTLLVITSLISAGILRVIYH